MQPAIRSLRQPLGGSSGDWRHRVLRFHLPLALASVVVIFLWMTLPLFQAAGHQDPPQTASQVSGHRGSSVGGQTGVHQPPQAAGHQSSQTGGQTAGHQSPAQADGATPPMDHSGDQTANLDGRQNHIFIARFTTATGYVALGLLALTLLIGPANLLLRRRNPVSSYLRRDVGTWTAVVSVIHLIVGFFVHETLSRFILKWVSIHAVNTAQMDAFVRIQHEGYTRSANPRQRSFQRST